MAKSKEKKQEGLSLDEQQKLVFDLSVVTGYLTLLKEYIASKGLTEEAVQYIKAKAKEAENKKKKDEVVQ